LKDSSENFQKSLNDGLLNLNGVFSIADILVSGSGSTMAVKAKFDHD